MRPIIAHFKLFISFISKDEEGASMVEYGLLVALIAIVAIGALSLMGIDLFGVFLRIYLSLFTLVPF